MKPGRTSRVVVAVAVGLAAFAAFEVSRAPCDRLLPRVLPRLLSVFDQGSADALWLRLSAVRTGVPAYGFELREASRVRIPGDDRANRWRDVQSGILAVIPPLEVAVVTPPYWADDPTAFFEEFETQNPGAAELGRPGSEVPPFLLVQLGGGVEDLLLQSLVVRGGEEALVWILRATADHQRLPEATAVALRAATVERLYSLAASEGLATQGAVEWRCNTLDGSVHAFVLFDGERLGRVSYVNNRRPSPGLESLLTALLEATGVTRQSGEYRLRNDQPISAAHPDRSPLN